MTTGKALNGKPYAGNPHVRFDEGAATPRRGSLLCKPVSFYVMTVAVVFAFVSVMAHTALGATYKVDIDRPGGIYRCGETATFTVRLLSTKHLAAAKAPRAARHRHEGS